MLLDLPETTAYLTPEERSYIIHRKSMIVFFRIPAFAYLVTEYDNSSVGEEEHFEIRHLWQALLDWQVWVLSFINLTVLTSSQSTLSFFSETC